MSRSVKSIDRPGLHIKPTDKFENTTQTKRFNGFIFVGSGSIAVNSGKGTLSLAPFFHNSQLAHFLAANIPRYKRKKSRNEAMRLLQLGM